MKRVEDMRARETLIGTLAPGSTPTVTIGLYNEVFRTRMRPVLGYTGLPDVMLAIERGEVEGYASMPFDTLRHSYKAQFTSGLIRVLAHSGDTPLPDLPDAPSARSSQHCSVSRWLVTRIWSSTCACTVGLSIGKRVRYRLNEQLFRKLLLAFLAILALVLLFK